MGDLHVLPGEAGRAKKEAADMLREAADRIESLDEAIEGVLYVVALRDGSFVRSFATAAPASKLALLGALHLEASRFAAEEWPW